MSKKSTKAEELIEALCDERVATKLIEKISNDLISKIEQKFNELVLDMENKLKISVTKVSEDIINESIIPLKKPS